MNDNVPPKMIIKRNNVSWTFVTTKLKKKYKTDADKFALLPIKPSTDKDKKIFLKWCGEDTLAIFSCRILRSLSCNWTNSSINREGKFSENDFIKCVQEMSARGETLKDLFTEKEQLVREIISGKTSPAKLDEIRGRLRVIQETIDFRKSENIVEDI